MSFFKFDEDDLFVNTIEAYPEFSFYIQGGKIYINDQTSSVGIDTAGSSSSNVDGIDHAPNGFVSLYERNISRYPSHLIHPFIIKSGKKDCFKSVKFADFCPVIPVIVI